MHALAFKLVFSKASYLILSVAIFSGMLVLLSILSEFIFTQPNLLFYVADYDIFRFALVVVVSALSGIVISMSIYRLRILRIRKVGSGFLGSIIGAGAGACSCGSVGFAVASTFGAIGGTATAFLTNYEIPLRLVSIGILIATYYVTVKALSTECKIQK